MCNQIPQSSQGRSNVVKKNTRKQILWVMLAWRNQQVQTNKRAKQETSAYTDEGKKPQRVRFYELQVLISDTPGIIQPIISSTTETSNVLPLEEECQYSLQQCKQLDLTWGANRE